MAENERAASASVEGASEDVVPAWAPVRGIACPGCPHRAAYIACKEALSRGRGRVICGDAGCTAVGPMHPAATTCPGGEAALHDRYKVPVPTDGTPEKPASAVCIHMFPDTAFASDEGAHVAAALPAEGETVVLAVLASSRAYLTREAVEGLAQRALDAGCADAGIVDPFDTVRVQAVLEELLGAPGVHAVVFASPCAQLQRGTYQAEPVEIDEYACASCHRCQQITGCPAIEFTPPVFRVRADMCAGCDLCVGHCRTHVIYSPRSRMTPEERSRARYAAACQ